jgi:hypothetical protein
MKLTEPSPVRDTTPARDTPREAARETEQHSALAPGLQLLIDRGTLSRAQADEVTAFAEQVDAAVSRREMTLAQAEAMGSLLGLRYAAANRSGRRLQ